MSYLRKVFGSVIVRFSFTLALLICSSGAQLVAQLPDLTVSDIQAPAAGKPGDMAIVRWTISNTGPVPTTGTFLFDNIYLSQDLVLNTDDDLSIGAYFHSNPIPAYSSKQESTYVFLPSDTTGTFYVFVVTDDGNFEAESNEANNSAYSSPIVISDTRPDLRVTQVTGPLTASSSQFVNVSYTVVNQGTDALANSYIYDAIMLSTDTIYDGSDQLIGSNAFDTSLAIGESYTFTRSSYIPAATSGIFYLLVRTNYTGLIAELDLENNVGYSAPIAIDLQRPDLVVSQVTAPELFRTGERVRCSYTLSNIGDTSTMGKTWSDILYISRDTIRDDSDRFVDVRDHSVSLSAGAFIVVSDSFDLPYGLENGTYHLIVVTDFINMINEANETNNIGVSGPISYLYTGPDFIVSEVSVPPSVSSGAELTVNFTVQNSGNQTSPARERTDAVYLSADAAFDYSDTYLGSTTDANAIAGGQSVGRSATVTLPLELSGTYYVIVYADMTYQITEYSELNNTGASSAMEITIGSGPDLQITSIAVPESVATGDQFTVNWEVTNSGTGSTGGGTWYDALYLSTDTMAGSGQMLGSFANAAALDAGQHYANSAQLTMPLGATGEYRIIVVANAAHQLPETNSANNSGYSASLRIAGCNGPDLLVTQLTFPPTVQSGQDIEVTWHVQNAGNRATTIPVWGDNLRLAIDTLLSQTWQLGQFDNPTYLGAGESYSETKTVKIPAELNGDYYLFLDVDLSGRQPECNEANNRFRAPSPIQIELAPPPDLQVVSVLAPANAFSGDTLNVLYTVKNFGAGAALGNWLDDIYLSLDTTLDVWSDNYRGNYGFTGSVLPESSYTGSAKILLPEGISGQYYLVLLTDANTKVFEYIWEKNNTGFSNPMTITLSPPPDLVVTGTVIPSTGSSGEKIGLSWTVQNQGPGETGSDYWFDAVYLSASATFDSASAKLVKIFRHDQSLQPDSSYTVLDSVTLPNGISGQYYVYVKTDQQNHQFEHTYEGNNITRSSAAIDLSLTPWPDLHVTGITAPSTAVAGEEVAIGYTIHNQSASASAKALWRDRIYISTSETWDLATSTYLGEYRHSGELAAGSSYTSDVVVQIPDEMSGLLFIYAMADAGNSVYEHTDEGNNTGRSDPVSADPYPAADLVVDTMTVPAAGIVDQPINVRFNVRNAGNGRTLTRSWKDALYLSVDTLLNPAVDVFLTRVERQEFMQPGEIYNRNLSVTVPKVTIGSYYLLVKADENNSVNDGNLANNVSHSSTQIGINVLPPPDLLPASVEFVSPATAGQPLQVVWSVTNQGPGATFQSSWYDGLYLSTDQALDTFDLRLGSFHRQASLPSGEAYAETLTVDIPVYVGGNYFILVKTDVRNDVGEGELEINNVSTQPVVIDQAPPGDLVVVSVTLPPAAIPGENLTVSWVTRNQGPNPVQGAMTDAVYISADQSWDVNDPVLGVVKRDIDLSPGAYITARITVRLGKVFAADSVGDITDILPGVSVGNYHLIVRTDIRNNISETIETNNATPSADQLAVDLPELVLGTPAAGTLSADQRKYYRVNVGAGLDLRLQLTSDLGSASNEIYVAFGRTPTPSNFDFTATEAFQANHEIVIPSTQSGSYYILVLARSVIGAESENYSIRADALPFSLMSVTPPEGGKGGKVTCLFTGAGFRDTTQFYLDGALGRINGEAVERISSTKAYVRFDLSSAEYGAYNAYAANGVAIVSRTDAFTVSVPKIDGLEHAIYSPYASRGLLIGRPASYDITVSNNNNNDYDLVLLTLLVPADQDFSLVTDDFVARPGPIGLPDTLRLPNAGVRINSDWAAMTVLAKGVRAGEILHARMNMKKVVASCGASCNEQLPVVVDVRGLSYSQFLGFEVDFMGQVRDEILKLDPSTVPPYILTLMQNPDWQFELEQGYREVGLLDDRPIISRTLPLVYEPNDTSGQKYARELLEFVSEGARSLCSKLLNIGQSMFTAYGLANAFMALAVAGTEASFFAGILVVGGPVGWVILAASAAMLAYNLYNLSQGGDMLAAKIFCRDLLSSFDPNDIIGPPGYGDRKWIGITATQPYTIRFENDPTLASAPAQVVTVTQKLDSTADARSFRLGRFGFANMSFDVPENRSFYSGRVDLRDSLGIYVDVSAGLDITKNEAFWILRSIDPATQQVPLDPMKGLLPINDSTDRGQGFVSYTIRAAATSHTGDSLRANATIVFDINPAINTPTIANTIDAVVPRSAVSPLSTTIGSSTFLVKWAGSDDSSGSGLARYSVFVSVNDSMFVPWLSDITDTSAAFSGVSGNKYAFYSLAKDNAGNSEPAKAAGETSTILTGVAEPEKELPKQFALYQNYPNPFNPVTTIQFDLPSAALISLKIYNLLGQEVRTVVDGIESPGTKSISFNMAQYASGVYFYRLNAMSVQDPRNLFTRTRKMILVK